jgi:periplasmic protein TonB
MREAFGESTDDPMEWVWLPEVTVVNQPQETPPPEPILEEQPIPPPPPPPEPAVAPEIQTLPESEPPPDKNAPPEPEPVPEPPPIMTVTPPPGEPDAWLEVRTNIMKSLRYPARARRSGMAGTVYLAIRVDDTGQIVDVEIKPPAPAKPLCDAVRTAALGAGPFPTLGEAIRQGKSPDAAEIPIRFELEAPPP